MRPNLNHASFGLSWTYSGRTLNAPYLYAVYNGCTRDAHRMHQLKSDGLPVSIPCTPIVHGVEAG
ncbi:MAG: hypothetical protein QM840_10215 [Verrucomicrobiota bacterium]|nr:hypothetical protein [Verrucomicrobiota bacterium]